MSLAIGERATCLLRMFATAFGCPYKSRPIITDHTLFTSDNISDMSETKVFGEPKLSDGTLARLGRNEGVRKMQTAERAAVVGSPDLESLTTSHIERAFFDRAAGIETVSA